LDEPLSHSMRRFEVTASSGNDGSDLISVPDQHSIVVPL
jgi:hypothetical protein